VLLHLVMVFGFTQVGAAPGNARSGSVPPIHKPRSNPKLLLLTPGCFIAAADKAVVVFCWDVAVRGTWRGGDRRAAAALRGEVGQEQNGYLRSYLHSLQHFREGVKSCFVVA